MPVETAKQMFETNYFGAIRTWTEIPMRRPSAECSSSLTRSSQNPRSPKQLRLSFRKLLDDELFKTTAEMTGVNLYAKSANAG